MANGSQKSEVAANVAIVVVAVLVGAVAVKQYLLAPSQASRPQQVKVGQSLAIQGVDWSQKPVHVVLALSNTCHYCTESAPLYRRITRYAAGQSNLHVMAILPQSVEEGAAYLRKLEVQVGEVRQAAFGSIPIAGTPTVMLVDNQGKVRNVWTGKLPPPGEAEVMKQIGCKESCS